MSRSPDHKAPDFWARRKAGVAAEAVAEARAVEQAEQASAQAVLEEKSDAEILAELDLPDPDTLQEGDDFSVFLAKAVPERIRRRALRKLWLSNPILANVDELVDYGEDFTDSAMVIEGMQTTYQVGKGMLKHVEEMARQAELEAQDELVANVDDDPVEDPETVVADATPDDLLPAPTAALAPEEPSFEPEPEPEQVPAPRRRMRFDFAGDPGQTATETS
ncbi:DUF3306 domain-containing protein [Shimia sp.]|uniref:DUF3306 domain-containing protein n=1 Tax=Shimia sp. TaxID=1954381 RepID=UPI00329870D7